MRRMKNFMFSGLLLAAVSVSAEVPPSIHVDGKNLTDTHAQSGVARRDGYAKPLF